VKIHRWEDIKRRSKLSKERLAEIESEVERDLLEMSLREMRELSGMTQVEMSGVAEMAQSELSRTERRDDHLLSTLRKYVEALGGELEVAAVFGDKRIRLRGV
jgi:hypothetical protein